MFSLESLRCLCAVVETGNFRLAAERVHRSQPAVSQQLKKLEEAAGQPLLDRKTGKLTQVGETVYTRAQQLLLDMDNLVETMQDFQDTGTMTLRVGTSDTTALYVLPEAVQHFMSMHPQTHLTLISRSTDAIITLVTRGEVDLGIVTLPQDKPDLVEEPLFQQQLALVVPVDHPLAKRERIQLSALKHTPLLLLDNGTRTGTLLEDYFKKHNFSPQAVLDSGSFEVIKRYIKEGAGVGFLPKEALTDLDTDLTTVHLPGLPGVTLGAVWRKGAYQSRVLQEFLGQLKQA